MRIALNEAQMAIAHGDVPVGAVVVNAGGEIVATDHKDLKTYRMIADTFDLPVEFHPRVSSARTMWHVKRTFPLVVSLGLLYHLPDQR